MITEVTDPALRSSPALARTLCEESPDSLSGRGKGWRISDFTDYGDRWPIVCRLLAVDQKVEQIVEFVRWWDEGVTPNRSPDRNNRSVISKDDAESLTGISAMQVSRWRKRIKDEA